MRGNITEWLGKGHPESGWLRAKPSSATHAHLTHCLYNLTDVTGPVSTPVSPCIRDDDNSVLGSWDSLAD